MWYIVYKINNLHINLNVWVIVRQILKHIVLPEGWETEVMSAQTVMCSSMAAILSLGWRKPKQRQETLLQGNPILRKADGAHRITVSAIRSMMECICAFLQIWIILSPGKSIFQRFTVQRMSCLWNWKRIQLPVQVSAHWDRGNIWSARDRPYIYGKTVSLHSCYVDAITTVCAG